MQSVTVTRKLVIKSAKDLYNLIKDKPFIISQSKQLSNFKDIFYLTIYGCNCDFDTQVNRSNNLYKNLNIENIVIDQLKTSLLCSEIIFLYEDKEIYRW